MDRAHECVPGAGEQGLGQQTAAHSWLALLQSEVLVNRRGAARLRFEDLQAAGGGSVGGLSPKVRQGLGLIFLLIFPFAVVQLVLTLPPAAWLICGRRAAGLGDLGFAGKELSSEPPGGHGHDRQTPPVVLWFLCIGNLMLNINFTIMMPGSEQVMVDVGGTTLLSGLAIGGYAMGSMISLPFVIHFSRRSFKLTLLLMSAVAVLGNLAYAIIGSLHGAGAIAGLILARVLCGIEGSAIIMMAAAVIHLSTGPATARASAGLTLAGCLGLILGPAISGVSQTCMPGLSPEIPPAAVMIAFAGAFGLAVALRFPAQSECFAMVGLEDPQLRAAPESHVAAREDLPAPSGIKVRSAWLYLGVLCVQYICRTFQRVSWEAGVLLILVEQYQFSSGAAGLLVCVPVLCSVPLVASAGILTSLGTTRSIRLLSLLELLGMLLMFRMGENRSTFPLVSLLIGSAIFYGANWVSVVPLAPLRARFAIEGHWALNVEALTGLSWAAAFCGYFYGPVVSRAILAVAPSQNLFAASFVLLWLGSFLAVEVGLHVLLGEGATHMGGSAPPVAGEGAALRQPGGPPALNARA